MLLYMKNQIRKRPTFLAGEICNPIKILQTKLLNFKLRFKIICGWISGHEITIIIIELVCLPVFVPKCRNRNYKLYQWTLSFSIRTPQLRKFKPTVYLLKHPPHQQSYWDFVTC